MVEFSRSWLAVLASALTMFVTIGAHAASVTIDVDGDPNISVGEQISFDVAVLDFPGFNGGGFNVAYDADLLRFVGFELEPGLSGADPTPQTLDDVGSSIIENVSFSTAPFAPALGPNAPIGTLIFEGVGTGVAVVSLQEATNANSRFVVFQFPAIVPVDSAVEFGTATAVVAEASAIPLPGAAMLFAGGLAAWRLGQRTAKRN